MWQLVIAEEMEDVRGVTATDMKYALMYCARTFFEQDDAMLHERVDKEITEMEDEDEEEEYEDDGKKRRIGKKKRRRRRMREEKRT